ncbi:MAG: hypothetical protein LQ345_000699 [Seirophora villosa]|nr:MAG: hypothetical protein LQ345_000699 [Seirophora villosa]
MTTQTTTTATPLTTLTPHISSNDKTTTDIPTGPLTAPLNFYSPPSDNSTPYNYVSTPPPTLPQRNFSDFTHATEIRDLRGREDDFKASVHGFAAVQDVSSRATRGTFDDETAIREIYYPEVEELLLQHTGAKRILLFDHTIRLAAPGANRAPVNRVHVDQTAKSAEQRVRFHLPAAEAEEMLKGRVRIINVWRPLNPPIAAYPLAVADSRSVPPEAMVGIEHRYPDRTGETAAVRWTEGQEWWYWSGMKADERLLLQCFDSEDGGARVPHSAFVDPRSGEGVGRESIEVRALVFG